MAKYRGVDGGMDVATVACGQMKSWNLDTQRPVLELTSMGDSARTIDLDIGEWNATAEMHFDYTDAQQKAFVDQAIAGVTAPDIAVKFKVSSTKYLSGNVKCSGARIANGGKGNIVALSVTLPGNGVLSLSWT